MDNFIDKYQTSAKSKILINTARMAPPSEQTKSIYENLKTLDELLKIQQDSMRQRLNVNVTKNQGVQYSQASAIQPLSDDVFGQDLQLNLTNSVCGTNNQNSDKAELAASTKLSIEKGALSIFTSRNASLSTGIYTPTVTTTTGAKYNAKTLGAHISQTNGSNVDVLNIGASVRYENLTARVTTVRDNFSQIQLG